MKKKQLWIIGVLAVLVLAVTLIGPTILLHAVRQNSLELYYPTETAWREKTVEDFKAATMGVLNTKLK